MYQQTEIKKKTKKNTKTDETAGYKMYMVWNIVCLLFEKLTSSLYMYY